MNYPCPLDYAKPKTKKQEKKAEQSARSMARSGRTGWERATLRSTEGIFHQRSREMKYGKKKERAKSWRPTEARLIPTVARATTHREKVIRSP